MIGLLRAQGQNADQKLLTSVGRTELRSAKFHTDEVTSIDVGDQPRSYGGLAFLGDLDGRITKLTKRSRL